VTGIEDKCVGSGQTGLHQFESPVIYMPGEIGQVTQVGADEGKPGFVRFYTLDPGHPLNGPGFCDITTDAINCICGIYDHTTILQQFNYFVDMPWIGILFIQFQKHLFRLRGLKIV
jgi:hypothetical protein